jgi:hypothetical protein
MSDLFNLRSVTKDQAKDTGMVLVFIFLILSYFFAFNLYVVSLCLLLLNMVWPNAFKPAAKIWFGFSRILGEVMSRVVLAIIFYIVVTPIGLIRILLNKDSLMLRKWKSGQDSVFSVRDHQYQQADIKNPY